jgi:hypothetical protein
MKGTLQGVFSLRIAENQVMDIAKLWGLSVSTLLLLPLAALAAEVPAKPAADVQHEVAELKRLVSDVSTRLEAMERRLAQLEKRLKLPARSIQGRWLLDPQRMVDERGVIWQEGRAIGVWGIDGADSRSMPRR